jgi:peptidoglycan/LPS O-acetylase OafA/YrhL
MGLSSDRGYVSRRFTVLDGLRGFAAIAVVVYHLRGLFGAPGQLSSRAAWLVAALGYGHLGVDVFFVLSGFVIAKTLSAAPITLKYFWRFLARRSLRLDPPYWASMFMALGVAIESRRFGHGSLELPSVRAVVAHLFYAQAVFGYPHINSVFWTLCIEIQLYTLYCAFVGAMERWWAVKNTRNVAVATLLLFALAIGWPIVHASSGDDRTWLIPFLNEFLIGSVVFYFSEGKLSAPEALGAIAVMGVAGAWKGSSAMLAAGATAAYLGWSSYRNELSTGLRWPLAQYLGRISYSLYLVHVPVIYTVLGLRTRVRGANTEVAALGLCVVATILSLGAAAVFHWCVEQPSQRLSRRLALPQGAEQVGGSAALQLHGGPPA